MYFGDLSARSAGTSRSARCRTLIEKYVRAGKLKIEYRSLETATREPETFKTQQIAALAAGKQQKSGTTSSSSTTSRAKRARNT